MSEILRGAQAQQEHLKTDEDFRASLSKLAQTGRVDAVQILLKHVTTPEAKKDLTSIINDIANDRKQGS